MSHWFHRNPLKATGPQMFEVKMFAHDSEALKIISDLKQSRARMLDLLPDPHHTIDQIETALKLYAALLRGFLLQPGDDYIVHYLGFIPSPCPNKPKVPTRSPARKKGQRLTWLMVTLKLYTIRL